MDTAPSLGVHRMTNDKDRGVSRLTRREASKGLFLLSGAWLLACSRDGVDDPGDASPYGDGGAGGTSATRGDAASGSWSDASAPVGDAGSPSGSSMADGSTAADAASASDGSTVADAASSSDAGAASDAGTGSSSSWASGGTKSMTGTYSDPFTSVASCALLVAATEGPCTESADQVRKDVSEGYTGLPMRLALRVLNGSCQPIAGAKVKIWHTQITGSYSGNTPNSNMCLKLQADSSKHYFRGVQTTDSAGRVDFDSCFPGWYRGRTIHVHFTVTSGGKSFTSQLVFEQSFVNEIFTSHPEYKGFGLPDTTNASDNVVGNANLATYIASTARMSDGALLAYKDLVVRL